MSWVPWVIGVAIVVAGVPALGALVVAALVVSVRLLVGVLGTHEEPGETPA